MAIWKPWSRDPLYSSPQSFGIFFPQSFEIFFPRCLLHGKIGHPLNLCYASIQMLCDCSFWCVVRSSIRVCILLLLECSSECWRFETVVVVNVVVGVFVRMLTLWNSCCCKCCCWSVRQNVVVVFVRCCVTHIHELHTGFSECFYVQGIFTVSFV